MKRYYISAKNEKGFEEVSETAFLAIVGDDLHRPYAKKVYRGEITLDEVPIQLRSMVEAIVTAKVEKCGIYNEREISIQELKSMIESVI